MSEDFTTGGHVRPITRWGTPVMHEATRPVTEFGDELHGLARDMFATMRAAERVGLAATQVGVGVSVFVYERPNADGRVQRGVVCNPVVELSRGKDRNLDITEEGCLSWLDGYSGVPRPDKTICWGQDVHGKEIEPLGTKLLARCFQHETNHLSGTVFRDHISDRSHRKLDAQVADLARRYPEDWPISPKRDSAPRLGEQ